MDDPVDRVEVAAEVLVLDLALDGCEELVDTEVVGVLR